MSKKRSLSAVELRIVRARVEHIVNEVNARAVAEHTKAHEAVITEVRALLDKFKETYRDQIWNAVRIDYSLERVRDDNYDIVKPQVGCMSIPRSDGRWDAVLEEVPGLGRPIAMLNQKLGKYRLSRGRGLDMAQVYFAGLNLTSSVVEQFAPRFRILADTIDNGLLSGDAAAMLDNINEWFEQEMSA